MTMEWYEWFGVVIFPLLLMTVLMVRSWYLQRRRDR